MQVRVLSGVPSSLGLTGQGTGVRILGSEFDSPGEDHSSVGDRTRKGGPCSGRCARLTNTHYAPESDWRGARLSTAFRRVRFPSGVPVQMSLSSKWPGDRPLKPTMRDRTPPGTPWGHRLMARIAGFQSADAGSFPAAPTKFRSGNSIGRVPGS